MLEENEKKRKSNSPNFYVGIGASAGGLEALEAFFSNMPTDTGMCFIVVQHLSPDYKSMMVELLSRKTTMKVYQIEDGMIPVKNSVYLVPPKKNLQIYHSKLMLTVQMRDLGVNLPIDTFFQSLAVDKKRNAIGIILSGTGSDGSYGVRSIKEHGGMVMVQNTDSAKFDGMPKSCIVTGFVDYILHVEEMGEKLVKYTNHPIVAKSAKEIEHTKEEEAYIKILSLIRNKTGIDYSSYKNNTILRRIERRVGVKQVSTIEDYIKLLTHSEEECEILSHEFLIGVTQFFRDKEAFEILEEKMLPDLFEKNKNTQKIRIWCAACSTGEEAYSIAILCKEYMESQKLDFDIKIFATDIDKYAIRQAGIAKFSENIVSAISSERLRKFFTKKQYMYQLTDEIRKMVIFSSHNILIDPPFSKLDLISCRNFLIYLKNDIQEKILTLFQYALEKGGGLFLGKSENLGDLFDNFDVVDETWNLYYLKKREIKPVLSNLLDIGKTKLQTKRIFPEQKKLPVIDNNAILFEKVLHYFALPGVVVDENNMIVHLFKGAQKYLIFPDGKPSYNLIEIAKPQISMILSNILYKVRKNNEDVRLLKVKINEDNRYKYLDISAHPLTLSKRETEYVIVTICEHKNISKQDEENEKPFQFNAESIERIRELEQEIQYRDENLQTTVEELETSNEELQATNEELIAANEELQSTNEELQSVNEELYTVNSQYQQKIEDLTVLNNDMNNLLANTKIGTLFLDNQLNVRKFTPEIAHIVNIMDIDIGRPFSHLTLKCNYPNLYNDVTEVIDTLKSKEIEIQLSKTSWSLIKIQPYRHQDKSIHGVILTLIDISALKREEKARQTSEEHYRILFKTMVHGVVYQNAEGKIISANPAAERILGLTKDQIMGLTSFDPQWRAMKQNGDDFPGDEHPSMQALKTGEHIKDVIMGVFNPKKKSITWININAIPVFHENEKEPYCVYTTFEDITSRYVADIELEKALEKLKISDKKYSMLFNSLTFGFAYHKIIVNKKGEPVDYEFLIVNRAFEELTGLKRENLIGKTVKDILPNTEDFWIDTYGKIALYDEKHEFEHYSGELKKRFKVYSYSPQKGYFVCIFNEIAQNN